MYVVQLCTLLENIGPDRNWQRRSTLVMVRNCVSRGLALAVERGGSKKAGRNGRGRGAASPNLLEVVVDSSDYVFRRIVHFIEGLWRNK